MKSLLLAALFCAVFSVEAQVGTSPRTLTRRIAPQLPPPPAKAARPAATHGAAQATALAGKASLTAAEAEEQEMKLSAEEKKKLQWQMERAEKGSDPAQFTLGTRYLEGDGVPKDLKKARKWLEASAKSGNADAKKKLAEHPELPPLDELKPVESTLVPVKPVESTVAPAKP